MATPGSDPAGNELPMSVDTNEISDNTASSINALEKPLFEVPQTMREDYVQNAVRFLSHPKVKGSPVVYRRSFLEKKGLTKEEIDEAFRREPDPPPSSTETAGSSNVAQLNSSSGTQPYATMQTVQSPAASAYANPIALSKSGPRIRWYHVLLSAGFVVSLGISAAVFWKNVALVRLKRWIREVVSEGVESAKENASIVELTKVVSEAATATSVENAKTREELRGAHYEVKKLLDSIMLLVNGQMKLMNESIQKLERGGDGLANGPYANAWRSQKPYGNGSLSDHGRGLYEEPSPLRTLKPQLAPVVDPRYADLSSTWNGRTTERPAPGQWAPPQTPSVVMPGAAEAIRQPKKLVTPTDAKQQSQQFGDNGSASSSVEIDGSVAEAQESVAAKPEEIEEEGEEES